MGHAGSREPLLEFRDPPNISGTVKARNFKFGAEMNSSEYYGKNEKLGQKVSCGGHVTHFWNFGTPLISRGCMKLETSNLSQRWTAVSTNEKVQN